MKLYVTLHGPDRCSAAALRNCLSYELAPIDCPVRKCRRDGLCTGPLVLRDGGGDRLARHDAADIARGTRFAPLCYWHLPPGVAAHVRDIHAAHCREHDASFAAWTFETTRSIKSRRWRRLRV
jgi:hypothetical protein